MARPIFYAPRRKRKVNSKSPPIVLFSTADWDNPFWTNKQHTAVHLAERGFPVLYIESLGLRQPKFASADFKRIFGRIRKLFRGVREVRPGLHVYSPLVLPLHRFAWVRHFNRVLLIGVLRIILWRLGYKRPWVWTYNPLVLDLAKALKAGKLVYHSVDDLAAAPGVDRETILTHETELLKASDAVFCTSRKIEAHCKQTAPGKTHYFGNVVDYGHFAKARKAGPEPLDLASVPKPRIGFVGALSSYKFDVDAVKLVARSRRDWHWVLIGKVGEGQPDAGMESLAGEPNIHFLGPKAYSDLPSYLAHFDVVTIPCPLNEYTRSMFPMKFFEYMAAGRPIVARGIDSLEEHTAHFHRYDDPASLVSGIERALSRGVPSPEDSDRLVKKNTWNERLDSMLEILSGQTMR